MPKSRLQFEVAPKLCTLAPKYLVFDMDFQVRHSSCVTWNHEM